MKKNGCTIGQECCVTGDTRIRTPFGDERIDALYLRARYGEALTVLTKIAGELREVAIKEVHTDSEAKDLYKVTLDDGCFVTLTGYHGIKADLPTRLIGWNPWMSAEVLRELGTAHLAFDGRKVKSVERLTPPTPPQLYDLELMEGDGYIANGIMVRAFVRATVKA